MMMMMDDNGVAFAHGTPPVSNVDNHQPVYYWTPSNSYTSNVWVKDQSARSNPKSSGQLCCCLSHFLISGKSSSQESPKMGLSATLAGTCRPLPRPSAVGFFPQSPFSERNAGFLTSGSKVGVRLVNPVLGGCFLPLRTAAKARELQDPARRVLRASSRAHGFSHQDAQDAPSVKPRAVLVGAAILLSLLGLSILPAFAAFGATRADTVAKAGASAAIAVGLEKPRFLWKAEFLSAAWSGFLAGCLHTLSGPDHLAALAPLSIGRTRMESAIVGALWGCGHDAGQVIFGLVFLLLKDRLRIEVVRAWGTRVVGMTLLVIGALGIREASEVATPCVALDGADCDTAITETSQNLTSGKKKIGLATFATGIVHGLQPDALMVILPALALPSRLAGSAYLCMFLCGTVMAMGSYTVFIGSCSEALKKRVPRITEKLTWASSLIAITLGVCILFSQLFGFSLF